MKIRIGFISNSSSSSFIVAFPCIPASPDGIQKLLFPEEDTIQVFDYIATTSEISEIIFKDMKKGAVNKKKMIKELLSGYFPEIDDVDIDCERYFKDPKYHKEKQKQKREIGNRIIRNFMKKNKGKVFFIFEYSDKHGPLSATMEHGEIFNKLSHITISNH